MPTPNDHRYVDRRPSSRQRPDTRGESPRTVVYTDGACSGNPGPGGWAWVVPGGSYRSGASGHTTNQRMELLAALDAVTSIPGPLEIVSDSRYIVNCFRDRWWEGWLRRDWTTSKKKPVANRDLWEPLVDAYRTRRISFRWVKGHGGNVWNDQADRLAVEASLAQQGVDGVGDVTSAEVSVDSGGAGARSANRPDDPQTTPASFGGTIAYPAGNGVASAGPGGWAWLVPEVRFRSGFEMRTTNPRMVLTAALDCLQTVEGRVELVSDSTYLVNCFQKRWWERWVQKGWRTAKDKPVANRDLWEPIIERFRSGQVNVRMVGRQDGNWPDTTSWLASEAARTYQGAEGENPPAAM